MKLSFTKFISAAVLLAASIGTANALPTIWVDNYNPVDFLMTAPQSFTITQDITDGVGGFRPGIDTVYSAELYVDVYDDFDLFSSEKVSFNFDGSGWTPATPVGGNFLWVDTLGFDVSSLVNDGLLNVTVKATQGDFYFADSTLVVYGNRGTAAESVPEPVTIAIFGLGLLALGFSLRRRKSLQSR